MNIILKIDNPVVINLFRKMTNEQLGKILRAYLNNNTKDLITEEEKQIYNELTRQKELRKKSNREKVVKSWETRKANRETNNKLQAQAQKDKDEINRLKAENENLKKASKQQYYNSNWNNNNNNNWKKKEEEPPKQPPKKPEKTEVGWNL
jgi:hypothetical protein